MADDKKFLSLEEKKRYVLDWLASEEKAKDLEARPGDLDLVSKRFEALMSVLRNPALSGVQEEDNFPVRSGGSRP